MKKDKRCKVCKIYCYGTFCIKHIDKSGKNHPNYGVQKLGVENPNYKTGKYVIRDKFCIDCNQKLKTMTALRCNSCSNSIKSIKHGKHLKPNYCIDCNIEISTMSTRCNSCSRMGELNVMYIDGRTDFRKGLRDCKKSQDWRNLVFKRDNFTCQNCGSTKSGTFQADHIKLLCILIDNFLKKYNQFSPIEDKETLLRLAMKHKPFWDINNGRTLCESCHKIKTKKDWKLINKVRIK